MRREAVLTNPCLLARPTYHGLCGRQIERVAKAALEVFPDAVSTGEHSREFPATEISIHLHSLFSYLENSMYSPKLMNEGLKPRMGELWSSAKHSDTQPKPYHSHTVALNILLEMTRPANIHSERAQHSLAFTAFTLSQPG